MTANTKTFVVNLAVKNRLEGSRVESCKVGDAVDNEGLVPAVCCCHTRPICVSDPGLQFIESLDLSANRAQQ